MERKGGVDGNTNYRKTSTKVRTSGPSKKKYDGTMSLAS